MKKQLQTLGIFAFVCLVVTTFALTPYTNDIYVFMGCAHQITHFDGSFLERAYHTWDVKGVFARTFMCIIHNVALEFADFASLKFENYTRLIYLAFSLTILLLSARLIQTNRRQRTLCFATLTIGLLATHYASHLQHEMTAVLIMTLSASLLVSNESAQHKRLAKDIFAGMLLGSLVYFKSIFILLPPGVLAAAVLMRPEITENRDRLFWRRIYAILLGGAVSGLTGLISILLIQPEEIQDMLDVSAFQHTAFSGGRWGLISLCWLGKNYILQCLPMNPITIIGTVAFCLNTFHDFKCRNTQKQICRFTIWFIPSVIIMLSNCYFAYHYYLYLFPALIECKEFFGHNIAENTTVKNLIAGLGVLLTVHFLATMSVFSVNFRDYIQANKLQHVYHEELHRAFPDLSSETILHLDGGAGGYLAGGRSHLKYTYPLPLQRIKEDSPYHDLPCRLSCKENAMNYTGKYILLDKGWLDCSISYPEIMDKISREYRPVGKVHFMAREWKVFGSPEYSDRILDLLARRTD